MPKQDKERRCVELKRFGFKQHTSEVSAQQDSFEVSIVHLHGTRAPVPPTPDIPLPCGWSLVVITDQWKERE